MRVGGREGGRKGGQEGRKEGERERERREGGRENGRREARREGGRRKRSRGTPTNSQFSSPQKQVSPPTPPAGESTCSSVDVSVDAGGRHFSFFVGHRPPLGLLPVRERESYVIAYTHTCTLYIHIIGIYIYLYMCLCEETFVC